jgi:phosphoenolpyruvate synthase/pyruvate phosphate dikinase
MSVRQQRLPSSKGFQVVFLHELSPSSPQYYGGKAVNLAHLQQNGIPTPRGFVIPTQGFSQFLASCKTLSTYSILQQAQENIEDMLHSAHAFRDAASRLKIPNEVADKIKAGFHQLQQHGQSPAGYAIRSSATTEDVQDCSFAGQADTYLCIRDIDQILDAVKHTWLSLFSPRALLYLHGKGIDLKQVQMGVIIQEMVPGEVSGVMFTTNVITNNPNQMLIDANWGLGESIVSGKVNADSYLIQKVPIQILERRLGDKQVFSSPYPWDKPKCTKFQETPLEKRRIFSLTDDQLHKLVKLGIEIESKMAQPQDIEWTLHDDSFTVLQTRPITTLSLLND